MRYKHDWSSAPEAWIARRATRNDSWDDLVNLGSWGASPDATAKLAKAFVETMGEVVSNWGTADDLELYCVHDQLGGYGNMDIFRPS